MKTVVTAILSLLAASAPVLACTGTQLNGGSMSFDYSQLSGGPIAGSFLSDGDLELDPPNMGTAAATYTLDGLHYLVVVGGFDNGTNFTDVGVIIVRGAVAPGPGPYAFDGANVFFFFVDDAVGYDVPTDICTTNWTLELLNAVAAGKYVSATGLVTFTDVSSSSVTGTFSGTAIDPVTSTTLLISSGQFNVQEATSVDPASWGGVKSTYR